MAASRRKLASLQLNAFIVLTVLVQLHSFGARASDDRKIYITKCSQRQYYLELNCGRDKAADITDTIRSQNHVRCDATGSPVDLNTVAGLVIDGCEFNALPDNLLRHFGGLQRLAVLNGQLTEFRVQDLPPQRAALETLGFRKNKLTAIEPAVLAAIPELVKLDVSYNELRAMPVFPDGCRLKELNVMANHITEVPADSIEGLPLLRKLNMRHNGLWNASLPFQHVKLLRELDLSFNGIGELLATDFIHLPKLEVLSLKRASLKNIEFGALSPLRRLRSLDLTQNKLTKMDFSAFVPAMAELEALELGGNNLTELDDNFDGLFPKLDRLILAENLFNCTYLGRFMRTLRRRAHAVDDNPNENLYQQPNFRGIVCEHVTEQTAAGDDGRAAADGEAIPEGFESGYNVSIFVLALWIAAGNLVICIAIVLVVRKSDTFR